MRYSTHQPLPGQFLAVRSLDDRILQTVPLAKWYKKKWNVLGDSITYGHRTAIPYHGTVLSLLKMGSVNNYGVSGTTIGKTNVENTNYMALRFSDMDNDVDLITVLGGTNDFGKNMTLGTIEDATVDTFYGAVRVLCEGLIDKYPTKTIAFFTPLQRSDLKTNTLGHTLIEYVDAILEVCALYSIPAFDLYRNGGIYADNPKVISALLSDKLHPDTAGHARIALKVASFINTL